MEGISTLLTKLMIPAKPKEIDAAKLKRDRLMAELRETSQQITALRSCFDHETDPDLIDSYIMALDSVEKRYSYLIKCAKQDKIAAF